MNYITEINCFYDWLVENSISGNAQALWHRLMAYCNAFGWKDEFSVSNTRLIDDIGMSRQELDRVRNVLVQKELITYKKGKGNQCGIYHMNSFVSHNVTHDITHDVTQCITQDVTQSGYSTLPLNKLNKTRLNETKNTPVVVSGESKLISDQEKLQLQQLTDFYQENIGLMQRHVLDEVVSFVEFGISPEAILFAMQKAVEGGANKSNWGYVKGILSRWLKGTIRTLEQAKAETVERKRQIEKPINQLYLQDTNNIFLDILREEQDKNDQRRNN